MGRSDGSLLSATLHVPPIQRRVSAGVCVSCCCHRVATVSVVKVEELWVVLVVRCVALRAVLDLGPVFGRE